MQKVNTRHSHITLISSVANENSWTMYNHVVRSVRAFKLPITVVKLNWTKRQCTCTSFSDAPLTYCTQDRISKKKRPSLVHMIGLQRQDQMSARTKAGAKWLSKVKRGQVVPKGESTTLNFPCRRILVCRSNSFVERLKVTLRLYIRIQIYHGN